jgi:hypothetical protein
MSFTQSIETKSAKRRTETKSGAACRDLFPKISKRTLSWMKLPRIVLGLREEDSSSRSRILAFENVSCPRSHRVLANNLTPGEWEHVDECQDCRDALLRLHEPVETRLPRLYRHLRLSLHDWNPVLQFVTLLAVLAAIGWGVHQVRMEARTANHAIVDSHDRSAPPPAIIPVVTPPSLSLILPQVSPSTAQLAQQVAAKLKWPWSSCPVSAGVINQWLGQGSMRRQIEKDLEIIERATPKKGPQRKEVARTWCEGLPEGSGALAREARREANRIQRDRTRE